MNELNDLDFKNSLNLVNPIQRMIQYIVAGLIFSSFFLDILFFKNLSIVISAVLFFLGLRLVRKANNSFRIAYFISCFYLCWSICEGMLSITPITIPTELVNLLSCVAILRVIFICQGLKPFLKEQLNVVQFMIYYLLMYGVAVIGVGVVDLKFLLIIIFIVFFILMVRALLDCQHDLLDNAYDITLSPIRVNAGRFTLSYIAITLLFVTATHFIYPFIIPQYQQQESFEYNDYPLVNTHHEKTSNLKIYDYDENHYLYVYQFTTEHIKKPIKSLKLDIYHILSAGYTEYEVKDILITDGQHNYQSKLYEGQMLKDNIFQSNYQPISYMVDLKPNFETDYTIEISMVVVKSILKQDSEDLEKTVEYSFGEDFFNFYYTYYDKLLINNEDNYSLHQQIAYQFEKGAVTDVHYSGDEMSNNE